MNAVFWCRSEQRSPAFVHLHDFIKKQTSSLRCQDVEGAVPYSYSGKFLPPQNRYALCGFYFVYLDRKSGAEICSPTPLYYFFYCCVLFYFSAPLGRLSPNEALPHAPQGTLSLDPTSPLASGLNLRFIARYARC